MEIEDFNPYRQNDRVYGGSAGHKVGIVYRGQNYLLKLPGSSRSLGLHTALSYTNSPLCEFIGSHIYGLLGIAVHETVLGIRNGRPAVACRDFLGAQDRLQQFGDIKVTFEPEFTDSSGNSTNGDGTDLEEVLLTIRQHPFFKGMEGTVEAHFWDMFVVDAFIGNPDRNNGNWGLVRHADGSTGLAPVYDNGNCLHNKWDDGKIMEAMHDARLLGNEVSEGKVCIFTVGGKKINPYHFIVGGSSTGCNQAVARLAPIMERSWGTIKNLVLSIPSSSKGVPIISDIRKEFYLTIMEKRLALLKEHAYRLGAHFQPAERRGDCGMEC